MKIARIHLYFPHGYRTGISIMPPHPFHVVSFCIVTNTLISNEFCSNTISMISWKFFIELFISQDFLCMCLQCLNPTGNATVSLRLNATQTQDVVAKIDTASPPRTQTLRHSGIIVFLNFHGLVFCRDLVVFKALRSCDRLPSVTAADRRILWTVLKSNFTEISDLIPWCTILYIS